MKLESEMGQSTTWRQWSLNAIEFLAYAGKNLKKMPVDAKAGMVMKTED